MIIGLLVSVTSLGLGFRLGSQRSIIHTSKPSLREERLHPPPQEHNTTEQKDEDEYDDDEDEDEELADGDLAAVQAGFTEQCKLVWLFLVTVSYPYNKRDVYYSQGAHRQNRFENDLRKGSCSVSSKHIMAFSEV